MTSCLERTNINKVFSKYSDFHCYYKLNYNKKAKFKIRKLLSGKYSHYLESYKENKKKPPFVLQEQETIL